MSNLSLNSEVENLGHGVKIVQWILKNPNIESRTFVCRVKKDSLQYGFYYKTGSCFACLDERDGYSQVLLKKVKNEKEIIIAFTDIKTDKKHSASHNLKVKDLNLNWFDAVAKQQVKDWLVASELHDATHQPPEARVSVSDGDMNDLIPSLRLLSVSQFEEVRGLVHNKLSHDVADESLEVFTSSLANLTKNFEPLILMLTKLADDNRPHAPRIVSAIETHLRTSAPPFKLSSLYLIDSIMKTVLGPTGDGTGPTYLELFKKNIVFNFLATFANVEDKNKRKAMYTLRMTWRDLFQNTLLYSLDIGVQGLDPAWPILAEHEKQSGAGLTNHQENAELLNKDMQLD